MQQLYILLPLVIKMASREKRHCVRITAKYYDKLFLSGISSLLSPTEIIQKKEINKIQHYYQSQIYFTNTGLSLMYIYWQA